MHKLHLLRHAKSSWKKDVEDHQRRLNRRGREAARRVDRKRCQHGKYVGHEPLLKPGAVTGFEIGRFYDGDAGFIELSAQSHPRDLLIRHQLASSLPYRFELLGGRQPILAYGLDAGEVLAL